MFEIWKADLSAVMNRDPAATSKLDVMLHYAGYKAIRRYRRAHWFYIHGFKRIARIISARTRRITGVEIHPAAKIGKSFFIDHGAGVVIGETAEIGDNVTIYQGVTLGGTGKDVGKRHPTIQDDVMISCGAKVLGPVTIGKGSKIGAGSVVLKDVPEHCTVVGIPGRVVKQKGVKVADLDQIKLPDPVMDAITTLKKQVEDLTKEIQSLKNQDK